MHTYNTSGGQNTIVHLPLPTHAYKPTFRTRTNIYIRAHVHTYTWRTPCHTGQYDRSHRCPCYRGSTVLHKLSFHHLLSSRLIFQVSPTTLSWHSSSTSTPTTPPSRTVTRWVSWNSRDSTWSLVSWPCASSMSLRKWREPQLPVSQRLILMSSVSIEMAKTRLYALEHEAQTSTFVLLLRWAF